MPEEIIPVEESEKMITVPESQVKELIRQNHELKQVVAANTEFMMISVTMLGEIPKNISMATIPMMIYEAYKNYKNNPDVVQELGRCLNTIKNIAPKYLNDEMLQKIEEISKKIPQLNG